MKKIEIMVPDLPESVADATVATWHKQPGDAVQCDEVLVEIETDKVVLEVPATTAGVLQEILQVEGATVVSRQPLGYLLPGATDATPSPSLNETLAFPSIVAINHDAPAASEGAHNVVSPAVRRLLAEHDLEGSQLSGSGIKGRLTPQDIEQHLTKPVVPIKVPLANPVVTTLAPQNPLEQPRRVPMNRLRQRIAERLLEAKQSTAMLTTFNEVNMQPMMQLRRELGETFEKQHGVRLGFMSFFVKAVVLALQRWPIINACLEGNDIVYYPQVDISIAVSTPRGLVTPVLRHCAAHSMAQIEQQIKTLAQQGRDGKLTVDDLTGGSFTITNGGLFGSLMSTPIINPPQSSILGMHAIKERPMAINGQVVILPMMYLALSYDHRLIDGQASVSFLVAVKEALEAPIRLLLEV
ncbi:2-oxoglutarate dehydrogenase complex dihydrolipoyllysine-residue succinyltransferase [unidentified bacterial endosymbiont]|uniref:2-oxoglutarate dehydrogenase complex dihydrolipoyllysine-residue succinyltransferase n=1 Tax=unidentified bacterial endosymbiont TaxID=2355 RepID=UPI0020A116B8|nr:2-oxoglutarate dehydrogenase complex dihydrolipoyllysine-residue succinyltransferase [unidentified bacterial endosymbiont]